MLEKIIAVLDKDKPNWELELADQQDLLDLARGMVTRDTLKMRCAQRWFHSILHSAYVAGIVEVKE